MEGLFFSPNIFHQITRLDGFLLFEPPQKDLDEPRRCPARRWDRSLKSRQSEQRPVVAPPTKTPSADAPAQSRHLIQKPPDSMLASGLPTLISDIFGIRCPGPHRDAAMPVDSAASRVRGSKARATAGEPVQATGGCALDVLRLAGQAGPSP